jgi:hypothetical protein
MKPCYRSILIGWLVALLCVAGAAEAQFRGTIFIAPCQQEIPIGNTEISRIWVCLEGPIAAGITAADFRLDGVPAGWPTQVSHHPSATVTGDLVGDGVHLEFSTCQPGKGQYLELFTVSITATSELTDVVLAVDTKIPSTDPNFPCPTVNRCSTDPSTKVCVGGFGSIVNGRKRGCPLAVEGTTWGKLKGLYGSH